MTHVVLVGSGFSRWLSESARDDAKWLGISEDLTPEYWCDAVPFGRLPLLTELARWMDKVLNAVADRPGSGLHPAPFDGSSPTNVVRDRLRLTGGSSDLAEVLDMLRSGVPYWLDQGETPTRKAVEGHLLDAFNWLMIRKTLECLCFERPSAAKRIDCLLNGAVLITTNYDVLLEALLAVPVQYVRGIGGDSTSERELIKLHGSVNWFVDPLDRNLGSDVRVVSLQDDPGSSGPPEFGRKDALKEWIGRIRGHAPARIPLIVPASRSKGSVYEHSYLRANWTRASTELWRCETLTVLGVGLHPTDLVLRSMLYSGLWSGKLKQVNVVDYALSTDSSTNWQALLNMLPTTTHLHNSTYEQWLAQ